MQRGAVRVTVGAAQVDAPLGTFAAADVATFDGTQFTGKSYAAIAAALGVAALEPGGLVTASPLPPIAGAVTITNTAYWVYFGRTTRAIVANFIEFAVSTIGAGAQTAELGLFSTTSAPTRAGLSMTKLVATPTVDTLITNGVKRNTADFATAVAAGVHLWGGIRTAMATTQPTIEGLTKDFAEGLIQTTATPGALTAAGPFAGAIIAHTLAWQAPDLRLICT